ncbi:MAG TPA: NAD(P)H-dependent oxidoreductase [Holophagaceae bacterium]|nr:NAD(P)H-dependent oxidoreductase [Holophagaceae bacterium]
MSSAPRRFLFLLASTRRDGNSEQLARRAAAHLPPGAEATWLRLDEHPLPPFVDTRHSSGYGDPDGTARHLAEATLAATDLVIVSPVYWYSLPAAAKLYFDHWSGWMRSPALQLRERMKGRQLWAVLVDSDQAHEGSAEPVLDSLRRTADFMGMRFGGALLGHGSKPGEALQDPAVGAAAATFFRSPGN